VWGDAKRLKDTDILRFQWPSIGKGWEKGLLDFARAQRLPSELTDQELVAKVLAQPNTRVDVVVGGKDRLIPSQQARRFFKNCAQVRVVELPGLGHDPFEEDMETFVRTVEDLLKLPRIEFGKLSGGNKLNSS